MQQFFSIDDDELSFDLTQPELIKLGYSIEPINQCLVFVTINNIKHIAACHADREAGSFFGLDLAGSEPKADS